MAALRKEIGKEIDKLSEEIAHLSQSIKDGKKQSSIHEKLDSPNIPDSKLLSDTIRRSSRQIKLTERAIAERVHKGKRIEKTFIKNYDAYKHTLRSAREDVKRQITEKELFTLMKNLKGNHNNLLAVYNDLKTYIDITNDFTLYQRRIDAATACHNDMQTLLNERVTEVGVEQFDYSKEMAKIKTLKKPYAASFYSSMTSLVGESVTEVKERVAVAVADLAAKKVQAEGLLVENKEIEHLNKLQAQKRQLLKSVEEERNSIMEAIDAQERKIECLRVQRGVDENTAVLNILKGAARTEDVDSIIQDYCPPSLHDQKDEATILPPKISTSTPLLTTNFQSNLNPLAQTFMVRPKSETQSEPKLSSPNSELPSSFATEIARTLDRSRLPVPTPRVFSGNPLEYTTFKRSFKTLIESKNLTAEERIYYLQQYVSGEARDAIAGCFYGSKDEDYHKAWKTLETRYGHSFKIQESLRNKLDQWPTIKSKDGPALQKYADFLKTCLDIMNHVPSLHVLNDSKENKKLVSKVPDFLVNRWCRITTYALDSTGSFPDFSHFVHFLEGEARNANNPVFSTVREKEKLSSSNTYKRDKVSRTLATEQGTKVDTSTESHKKKIERKCPFCEGEHFLPNCQKFTDLTREKKVKYIQEHKRCFGCLRMGHVTKDCKTKHRCKTCKGIHPTALHFNQDKDQTHVKTVERAAALNVSSQGTSTTNVVPVWVSSRSNPKREELVYALLDTQSDSTFIDQDLCKRLCLQSEPTTIKITTLLNKNTLINCSRVIDVQVRGHSSNDFIDLPTAYTRDHIPVDKGHIPTSKTAEAWPHLAHLARELDPLLDIEVGLLIGYNCSRALAPRDVITGNTGEPYAVRTDLGWSIVGSLPTNLSTETSTCFRSSLKEVLYATPKDLLKLFETDFKDTDQSTSPISQDDIKFLNILENNFYKRQGSPADATPFQKQTKLTK